MKNPCKTKLLSDLPAKEDTFGGSHERVAQAIANLIEEEDGGKAIALTGPWGSGKSTVVELLRSKLESPNEPSTTKYGVFVFDAWAHQGDPLRRSFLEELISFLVEIDWAKEETWKKDLGILTRRKEFTETTSEPVLTVPGKLMAMCALLLPVGYAFLARDGSNGTFLGFPNEKVGLFLSFSPLLVSLGTWIFWRPTWRLWKREFWGKHRAPHQDDSVVSLFLHKTRETFKTKTIRTPDPTSLEFRDIFHRILNDTLSDTNCNLMVVIDNLDRIDPDEAMAIWSTMRTFFNVDGQGAHTWLNRFWLLVPFDADSLKILWEHEKDRPKGLADAFRDKTFQVTFRVSPPVLTDWKKFFQNRLNEAFPENHSKDEFHTIYRLYRLEGPLKERPLTPRDIKLFINKLGAIHRQWEDEIRLPIQALYILYKDKITNPETDITNEDLLDSQVERLIDEPDWQIYFAALHLNVEPKIAMQVLIGIPVEKALREGNTEELKQRQSVPGFVEVCEHVIGENHIDWAKDEPSAIAGSALSLGGLEQIEGPDWEQIWRSLRISASEVKSWTDLDERMGTGIVTIVERCQEADYSALSEKLVRSLSNSVPEPEEEGTTLDREKARQWVQGTLPIIRKLHDIGQGKLLERDFRVIGTARSYIEVMTVLSVDGVSEDLVTFLKPEKQPELIVTELGNICSKGELIEPYSNTIELMLKVDDSKEWPWDQLTTALADQLDGNKNLPPDQIVGGVSTIVNLVEHNAVQENSFQQLAARGHIMHNLNQAHAGSDHIAVAWCLFTILKFVPAGEVKHIGNSQRGLNLYNGILNEPEKHHPIPQHLADLILKYSKIESLMNQTSTAPNTKKLVTAVIEIISTRDDAYQHIPPKIFIDHYQDKIETLPEDALRDLTIKLVEKADLLSVITEYEFSKERAGLYIQTLQVTEGRERGPYIEYLRKGLRELQKDVWDSELRQEDKPLELLIYLVENRETPGLGLNFKDALYDHAKEMIEEEYTPELEDRWSKLPEALSPGHKETFFCDLRDELINKAGEKIGPALRIYGDALLESGVLEEKADDVVRSLFRGILGGEIPGELAWILQVLNRAPQILERCRRASKDEFMERVRQSLGKEDLSEDIVDTAQEIARAIGINLEEITAEEAEPEDDSNVEPSR